MSEHGSGDDRFRKLIRDLDVGVLVQGPSLEIRVSNRAARALLGVTEDQLRGRTSYDPAWRIVHEDGTPYPADQRPAATVLATGRPLRGIVMGIDRPTLGDRVWLLVNVEPELDAQGRVVEVVTTMSDLTERKRLEASLLRAQKLESIGRLAGGVAHDFNNLLTVILSNTAQVRDALPADSPQRSDLDEAFEAGQRAASLTRQLLTFASRQITVPKVIDVGQTLTAVEKMLRRLIGEQVELRLEVSEGCWSTRIDPAELEQLIMNLAVNARDAMPSGGRLLITAGNVSLPEAGDGSGAAPAGDYVLLRVVDSGQGMDEATRDRIFEPFFTTKAVGEGTGLGLAIVHGVAQKHGGHVRVESTVGQGTAFAIYLPRVSALPAAPKPVTTSALPTGRERILLVEDERAVRRLAVRILARQGYEIIEADDGEAALRIARADASRIDLVITDLVMPNVDGKRLAAELEKDKPGLRVLYVSGYAADLAPGASAPFLAKPYTAEELTKKVRQVLDER